MSAIILDKEFSPAEAERGKFAWIDPAFLSTISPTSPSSRGRYALLTYAIGGSISSTNVETANNTLIYSDIYTTTAVVLSPTIPISYLEIQNNSPNVAYVALSSTSFSGLTGKGLILQPYSFYSIARNITTLTVGASAANTDLRIMAHNKV